MSGASPDSPNEEDEMLTNARRIRAKPAALLMAACAMVGCHAKLKRGELAWPYQTSGHI